MNEEIRQKLEKIKVLADDAKGRPEGVAALAMFQRLLKKYGVEESEIHRKDPDIIERRTLYACGRAASWIMALAAVIASHFRCVAFHQRAGELTRVVFDGMPEDLDVAESAFTAALAVIRRQAAAIDVTASDYGVREARNSYRLGFIRGLDDAFKTQEASGELGIIVVTPEAVTKRAEGKKMHSYNCNAYDPKSFYSGERDGRNYLNKRGLGVDQCKLSV